MGGRKARFHTKIIEGEKVRSMYSLIKSSFIFFWRREEFDFDFKAPEVSICVSQL